MNRDLILLELVALDAQLRRIRRLAQSIGSSDELKARLPPLITQISRRVNALCSRIAQQEGE
jgi:hypothetical protein